MRRTGKESKKRVSEREAIREQIDPKTVWAVVEDVEYEGYEVLGLFHREVDAKAFAKLQKPVGPGVIKVFGMEVK